MPLIDPITLASAVRDDIAGLAAPATPSSIEYSSLSRNPIYRYIAGSGLIALIVLICSNLGLDGQTGRLLSVVSAAILGSAFSQLYSASEYLQNRTFDRQYLQIYALRFVLGIISGVILGQYLPDLMHLHPQGDTSKSGMVSDTTLGGVAPAAIALVGGFSSEAVFQILQRFSDTLVTLVRGPDKEKAQAAAEKDVARKKNETAGKLHDVMDQNSPEDMRAALKTVIKDLHKPG